MENFAKETITLRGSSGKQTTITYEELANKQDIYGVVEVYKGLYKIKITRWYYLDEEFETAEKAGAKLIKIIQKIDTIRMNSK